MFHEMSTDDVILRIWCIIVYGGQKNFFAISLVSSLRFWSSKDYFGIITASTIMIQRQTTLFLPSLVTKQPSMAITNPGTSNLYPLRMDVNKNSNIQRRVI